MIPLLRKQTVYMPFTKLFTIFVGILSLIGPSNAFVALRPSWTLSSTTTSRHVIQFEHTALLLSEQSGLGSSISGFLSVSLLVSIATFYYANTVYTPEILENSKQMRLAAKEAAKMEANRAMGARRLAFRVKIASRPVMTKRSVDNLGRVTKY